MDTTNSRPQTYDEFVIFLSKVLLVEKEKLTPETSFTDDLYIDSLNLVEMALSIEKLGVSIPVEAYWEIRTVGDAYQTYVEHNSHQS